MLYTSLVSSLRVTRPLRSSNRSTRDLSHRNDGCSLCTPTNNRLGNARRVWPPAHLQIAHPSLGVAALVNSGRFRARASFRDMIKNRGAIGGGGGGADGEKDDAVSKLIDKYGDQMGEVGFGGVVGFCRCVFVFISCVPRDTIFF